MRLPQLHGDAVCFSEEKDPRDPRIPLIPFVRAGPRRFFDLFSLNLSNGYPIERKLGGEVIGWSFEDNAKPRAPLPPTSCMGREQLVSQKMVIIYNVYESRNSTETNGSQEGARLLEIDADDGIPSQKWPQWKVGEKSERIREPERMTKTAGSSSGNADSEA